MTDILAEWHELLTRRTSIGNLPDTYEALKQWREDATAVFGRAADEIEQLRAESESFRQACYKLKKALEESHAACKIHIQTHTTTNETIAELIRQRDALRAEQGIA